MEENRNKFCIVHFEPDGIDIEVAAGSNLLHAAHKAGLYLNSICGGDGYCGKCQVIVDNLQKVQSKPTTLLTEKKISQNIVLACQTKVLSDVIVTVPVSHNLQTGQILTDIDSDILNNLDEHEMGGIFELDPIVNKIFLEMSPPTVQDHTADLERLYAAIRNKIKVGSIHSDLDIINKISKLLRNCNYKATVTIGYRDECVEIIEIEAGDTSNHNFAVAVDIGTTTVVAHLTDLTTASTIDTEAMYNSQINFGEDYIRRIIYAEEHNAFDELQNRIVNDINTLIEKLTARQNIDLHKINTVVCPGNTAMIHFLLKLDPIRIRREPYIASACSVPPIPTSQIGIKINPRGLLYCLPAVAAYVGSDIVAGILATRIFTKDGISLFIDIGTNGEVVLGNRDWLVCASSSAGPAFEGSGVRHGMRAANGAIEKLTIEKDGSVNYRTIGNSPAVGICGSGLLDTLASFFINGIIDRTGRFKASSNIRLNEGDEGLQFQLTNATEDFPEIVITQADIDNLIRSKAGVFAAIRVLMESTQTKPQDLDAIFLAGGFGNYLNIEQAVNIGMLPDVPLEKIQFVGNTSIAGAKTAIMSRKALITAHKIAESTAYFDLMTEPGYMEEFTRANFLPHTDLSLFPSVMERMVNRD